MSEPSKEALEKALKITEDGRNVTGVAAALQKLMDERDDTQKTASDNWDEAIREGHARIQAEKRAEAAEAKLAECVRRVRAFNGGLFSYVGRNPRRVRTKGNPMNLSKEEKKYLLDGLRGQLMDALRKAYDTLQSDYKHAYTVKSHLAKVMRAAERYEEFEK